MAFKDFSNKKIPTILAVLVLIGGLVGGIILVGRSQLLSIKAGPTAVPRNIKVVNLGSTGMTVTWTTDTPVVGLIKYSENPAKLSLPAGDVRDQKTGVTSAFTTHYIDVVGLKPDKTYYFEIGSGGSTYNDNGKPYQIKTFTNVTAATEDMISGKILLPSGQPAGGVIVFVEMDKTGTLAALSKDDGAWKMPLSSVRDRQGKLVSYDPATTGVTIFAQGGSTGSATALTNTKNDSPVPDITLGKTHNFVKGEIVDAEGPDAQARGNGFGDLPDATEKGADSVKLISPLLGENIATSSPTFAGTGPAETILTLSLSLPTTQRKDITIDSTKKWSYKPVLPLKIGKYSLTVSYIDEKGVRQSIVRSFNVVTALGKGVTPAYSATDSGTLSPTPTPTDGPEATGGAIIDVGETDITYFLLGSGLLFLIFGLLWKKKVNKFYG